MNWNHFILLLIGIYLGYYSLNIIADLFLKKNPQSLEADQDILFFSEDSQPEIIIYDDEPEKVSHEITSPQQDSPAGESPQTYPSPVLNSIGAVSLKELNKVAKAGLLQYTKAIPY